jgi:hypothetical protein
MVWELVAGIGPPVFESWCTVNFVQIATVDNAPVVNRISKEDQSVTGLKQAG